MVRKTAPTKQQVAYQVNCNDDAVISSNQLSILVGLSHLRLDELCKMGHMEKADRGFYWLIKSVRGYCDYLRTLRKMNAPNDRLRSAKADMAALKFKEASGELVSKLEVEKAWENAAVLFRQHMLSLPGKIAPLVAHETDIKSINKIIEQHIHEALRKLATETDVDGIAEADDDEGLSEDSAADQAVH